MKLRIFTCVWFLLGGMVLGQEKIEIRTTGVAQPALQSFDDTMLEFMQKRGIPGGALAVVKEGRLLYARGYGWADREQKEPVQPTSLFRIASLSKPVTAVAILTLVENPRYHLTLDARMLRLLDLKPLLEGGAKMDPRWEDITLRQLLQHTAGFDHEKSGDPMFQSVPIAKALGKPPPASSEDIIRYRLGRPLDFDPGTRECYSNFGYCILGRILEKVSGQPYEAYGKANVLAPMGIQRMQLGRTLFENRAKAEVHYYQPNEPLSRSVFSADAKIKVPNPYGGWDLEAMDAHGGWLASAVDLARFAAALDVPAKKPILSAPTLRVMYERPPPPVGLEANGHPAAAFYACGWMVRPVQGEKANYQHAGSLPGTYSLLVRRWDGLSWVVLFNQRSDSDDEIDGALHQAAAAVQRWPDQNLFPQFP